MDEATARSWVRDELAVPRETLERIEAFVGLVTAENQRQNLVAAGSLDSMWNRHVADSAQLVRFAPAHGSWVDLGTGAGFPGMIIALIRPELVTLVEQRKLRVDFLHRAVNHLGMTDRVRIFTGRVEQMPPEAYDVISARAFAPLERLFAVSAHLAAPSTRWILPKGRNAKSELEAARASWQGAFRLEPSVSDADARILIAERVRRTSKGRRIQ